MILQQALTESFKKHTSNIVFETDNSRITYGQLISRAGSIQKMLTHNALPRESFIGIDLAEIPDLVAAILAVAYCRHIFVPLDRKLPPERLKTMIANLGLSNVITDQSSPWVELYKETGVNVYDVEKLVNNTEQAGLEDLGTYQEEDSLYVYFTSGSTGVPKAVVGKNDSLLHFVQWEIREFDIREKMRFSQFISPFFDAFLRDIFVPLMSGGTICIPPHEDGFYNPVRLAEWIDAKKINFIHCVPSVFMAINGDHLTGENYKSLACVLMSGERIVPSALRSWYQIFGERIQLVNLYGLTETTMIRTFYRIKPEDVHKVRISVGRPIDDTVILIADEDLKPCPPLMTGEVYIISAYMTKGYYNDEAGNQAKFVQVDSRRAFKTGDKARMLPDGTIDLLGRDDRQIKLHGIRIEIDEVEAVMAGSGMVDKVFVTTSAAGNETEDYLVAFVVGKNASDDQALMDKLNAHIKTRLPEYMIPRKIKLLADFPLLNNGKIDQQTLLKTLTLAAQLGPKDEIERRLLNLWRGVLGDKPISTDESFLNIGGHSITMMRLVGRIYKEFHVKFPLRDLFLNLTIQKQADYIRKVKEDDAYVIRHATEKPGYNLTAVQERMYVHWQMEKSNIAFNMPVNLKIVGDYDFDRLQDVLRQLVQRHESFRTSFKLIDNKVYQVINDNVDFELQKISAPRGQLEQVIRSFITPFDLEQAPLMRAAVVSHEGEAPVLVVDVHHIVCDGQSQAILHRELNHLYGGSGTLQPVGKRYRDFAEWEAGFRHTAEYMSNKEFWLNLFDSGIPRTSLPVISEEKQDELWGGEHCFEIAKDEVSPLLQFLKEKDITCFAGIFSIYYLFAAKLIGQGDPVVGINTSGRVQSDLEKIVGMFVKTLPVHYQLDLNLSFRALVMDMNRYLGEVLSRQVYDISDIVSDLSKSSNQRIEKLFELCFSYQNDVENSQPDTRWHFVPTRRDRASSHYPLLMYATEKSDRFEFQFTYLNRYFTKNDVLKIADEFVSLTRKISADPDQLIVECISGETVEPLFKEEDFSINL